MTAPLISNNPLVWDVTGQAPQLARVRGWVADGVPRLAGTDVLDDLLLVVTELVGNAHDHARGPTVLRLLRNLGPLDRVRIEVDDPSSRPPVPGRSRLAGTRGRGLVLVGELSHRWGWNPTPTGKTVWATVACG
ncbi:ATP-binding protein [Saccharothrix sp. Mg75]|uniref:ATP-binding protein n=1 Tax=Saccharothrix sp. Mg75 TaxID=3445357 RepID=UPI003EE8F373